MDFFESLPEPPPPERPQPPPRHPWERPETVIPGSVAAEALLARTEDVAVAVGSLRAYRNGFEFTVHVRQRRVEEFLHDPFGRHPRRRGEADLPAQALRLGILYADGRRVAISGRFHPSHDELAAGELVLHHGGSRGSDRQWDGDFWVHPLPPDGPVTFVVSWLAKGVTEARAQVDGAAVRAAADRAVELWPDDPDPASTRASASVRVTATNSGQPPAET
jgi:hypothetical protein